MNISLTEECSEWCRLLSLSCFIPSSPLIPLQLFLSLPFLSGEKYMHPKVSNHGSVFLMGQALVVHSWPPGNEWQPVIESQVRKGSESTLSISVGDARKMEKSGENEWLTAGILLVSCDPVCFVTCHVCVYEVGMALRTNRNNRNKNVKDKNIPSDGAVPVGHSSICWASSWEACGRSLIRVGLRESGRRGTGEEGKQTAKTQFFFRLGERNGKIDVGSRVRRGTFKEDFFFSWRKL